MDSIFTTDQDESELSAPKISKVIKACLKRIEMHSPGWSQVWVGPKHQVLVSVPEPKVLCLDRQRDDDEPYPWIIRSEELKPVIPRFLSNCLLDFRFRFTDGHQVYSFNLKFQSGRIEFRNGKLFLYNVSDVEAFVLEAENLDRIFTF